MSLLSPPSYAPLRAVFVLLFTGLLCMPSMAAQRSEKLSASSPPRNLRRLDLAGVPTTGYPEFTFVQAFNTGDPVQVGIDIQRVRRLAGLEVEIYVIEHRTPAEWELDRTLISANSGPVTFTLTDGTLGQNMVEVDSGTLTGFSGGAQVGIGYDIVVDANKNGFLDTDDLIDGWGADAGLYVMPNLLGRGPYGTSVADFSQGPFRRQRTYYPTEVASLGRLPLVIISHGNGHSYLWYQHIGDFLSSWGYIVSSHENETGPGIQTASESTLRNTDIFLNNLDVIASGELAGHVDPNTIVWLGHSRGGEGVAYAYNQLVNGLPFPVTFQASDIKLISSIAPTDFLGPDFSNPLDVPYQLWTGASDDDVNGCANNNIAQPFHLHDRAAGERMSIALKGVGHGDFHSNFPSDSVADGPCLVGRTRTHRVMRGYLLPLLDYVLNDSEPALEYLWRPYESFRPIPANSSQCIIASLMYRPDPSGRRLVVDDFQSNPELELSSSGGAVTWNVAGLVEDRLDDRNTTFTGDTGERFNGMTLGSDLDDTKGIIFEYGSFDSNYILFELPGAVQDVADLKYLSFRACRVTRNALTTALRGDLDFTVLLVDDREHVSEIRIGAYGGLAEPYQRRTCGAGRGWANEWETFRIPLRDFNSSGRPLDLHNVRAVGFRFGTDHGSSMGRLGLDEIEFTAK
jgi:hypothetical protein